MWGSALRWAPQHRSLWIGPSIPSDPSFATAALTFGQPHSEPRCPWYELVSQPVHVRVGNSPQGQRIYGSSANPITHQNGTQGHVLLWWARSQPKRGMCRKVHQFGPEQPRSPPAMGVPPHLPSHLPPHLDVATVAVAVFKFAPMGNAGLGLSEEQLHWVAPFFLSWVPTTHALALLLCLLVFP